MAYDLLIKNGLVVDGSGGPSFHGDVGVKDSKIVGIGRFSETATRTINADGRVVAPGFIDHHTHYDPQALWDPLCSSTAQNGNTSVVVGMCGQVLAPVRPGDDNWYMEFFAEAEDVPLSAMRKGLNFNWETIGEYLDALGQRRGVNVGALVGHSGVRRYIMGESFEREATPAQIEAMRGVVRDGMLAGALGFSTSPGGMRGSPAAVASDEDLFALASVLGELGSGIFQVRGGSDVSMGTAAELSRRTGRSAVYNILFQREDDPDGWKDHLKKLEESFKSGTRVYASCISVTGGPIFNLRLGMDVPQDEDMISPRTVFDGMPTWDRVMAQPVQERMQALRDPQVRTTLSAEAVEGTASPSAGTPRLLGLSRGFNRRWDLVEVFMAIGRGTGTWKVRALSRSPRSRVRTLWALSWTCPLTRTSTPTSYVSHLTTTSSPRGRSWARPIPSSGPPTEAPARTRWTASSTVPTC